MRYYTVTVPPTMDQGSTTLVVCANTIETKAMAALWYYNRMRERDGQDELNRMPNGTTYTRRK